MGLCVLLWRKSDLGLPRSRFFETERRVKDNAPYLCDLCVLLWRKIRSGLATKDHKELKEMNFLTQTHPRVVN
jgi:hypothetical protein